MAIKVKSYYTLDQLIAKLRLYRKAHPEAGRLPVILWHDPEGNGFDVVARGGVTEGEGFHNGAKAVELHPLGADLMYDDIEILT